MKYDEKRNIKLINENKEKINVIQLRFNSIDLINLIRF